MMCILYYLYKVILWTHWPMTWRVFCWLCGGVYEVQSCQISECENKWAYMVKKRKAQNIKECVLWWNQLLSASHCFSCWTNHDYDLGWTNHDLEQIIIIPWPRCAGEWFCDCKYCKYVKLECHSVWQYGFGNGVELKPDNFLGRSLCLAIVSQQLYSILQELQFWTFRGGRYLQSGNPKRNHRYLSHFFEHILGLQEVHDAYEVQ